MVINHLGRWRGQRQEDLCATTVISRVAAQLDAAGIGGDGQVLQELVGVALGKWSVPPQPSISCLGKVVVHDALTWAESKDLLGNYLGSVSCLM